MSVSSGTQLSDDNHLLVLSKAYGNILCGDGSLGIIFPYSLLRTTKMTVLNNQQGIGESDFSAACYELRKSCYP